MGLLIPARRSPHPETPPGKSALGRQQGCAQLSATLAPRKTNRLPASSLCPRSPSPSLQQVGAFSWRDSSPQWGVRASDPRRLAACAREPGTRVEKRGPQLPSVQVIISLTPWMKEVWTFLSQTPSFCRECPRGRRMTVPAQSKLHWLNTQRS